MIRIYEVAKDLGLPNKIIVEKIRGLGIDVKNHMSSISTDDVDRLKKSLERPKTEATVEKRLKSTVIRRRSKGAGAIVQATEPASSTSAIEVVDSTTPELSAHSLGESALGDSAVETDYTHSDKPAPNGTVEDWASTTASAKALKSRTASITTKTASDLGAETSTESSSRSETSEEMSKGAANEAVVKSGEVELAKEAAVGSAEKTEAAPAKPKRVIRYAPGFEPGKYSPPPPRGSRAAGARSTAAGEPISAAEAAKLMMGKPKRRSTRVVITEVDPRKSRSPFNRLNDRRPGYRGRRGRPSGPSKPGKKTTITQPAEHKRVIRVEDAISISELARQMSVKAPEVLKKIWAMGMRNITLTQSIDIDTATLVASEFGYEVEDVSFNEETLLQAVEDSPESLKERAPVITVMGHVDHGKTSLLDAIRGADIAASEAGGITQHIGAYRVATPRGELVFLDTPGHEAFTQMRARGAQCTDIVVLVTAADDGVMPQTAEAIDHAKAAGVPMIVAINKIDKADANPDMVRNQLSEKNVVSEEWGGDTIFKQVSAMTKQGVDELLEALVLQSEILELKANPDKSGVGVVIESRMDRARGPISTILIQEGTLRIGDTIIVGEHMGKVRAMMNDRGEQLNEAGPSVPVEILGISGVPEAGDSLNAVTNDKAARQITDFRHARSRKKELSNVSATKTFEDLLGKIQAGSPAELKVVVKADVHGSTEAIKDSLIKLATERVAVDVVSTGVGGIHETDVNLAKAAGATILGFNVRADGKATSLAEREGVGIQLYDVIYELLDDVKDLMRGLLPKDRNEKPIGKAEVRQTFVIPKLGLVAGCSVIDGKVIRNTHLRLVRDNVKIYDGKISSLRRFKDDVKEVGVGYECGIGIAGCKDMKEGDIIEAYEVEEVTPEL